MIDLETSEINVGESNRTVTLRVMANGTSEFDYNIDLTINDVSTGEWTMIFDLFLMIAWFNIVQAQALCEILDLIISITCRF